MVCLLGDVKNLVVLVSWGVELGNCKELSFTAIVEGWDRSGIQKNPVVQWTCCL